MPMRDLNKEVSNSQKHCVKLIRCQGNKGVILHERKYHVTHVCNNDISMIWRIKPGPNHRVESFTLCSESNCQHTQTGAKQNENLPASRTHKQTN